MTKAQNLFFDLDGTLTDPREGITGSLRHALSRMGRDAPPPGELVKYIGPPLRDSFKTLLQSDDQELIERAIVYYRERYGEIGFLENAVYPGILEALRYLSGRQKLFVVTSKALVFAEQIVKHFGLADYFQDVFGPELGGRFDRKDALIQHLIVERRFKETETIMIGDRQDDILAGKKNGTGTIGVLYGFGSREELSASQPDLLCSFPSEIISAVGLWEERVIDHDCDLDHDQER